MTEYLELAANAAICIGGLVFALKNIHRKVSHKLRLRRIRRALNEFEFSASTSTPVVEPVKHRVVTHPEPSDQSEQAQTFRKAYDYALAGGWQPRDASVIAERTCHLVYGVGKSFGIACEEAVNERIMILEDSGRHDRSVHS